MPNKKSARRSNKNFVAIPFQNTVALGTLGDGSVITLSLFGADLLEDLFIISTDMSASVKGLTTTEGVPSDCGIAHNDYTATEIKENLDVQFLGPGSKIEQERSRRLVRKVGVLNSFDTSAKTESSMIGREGSRIVRSKMKFVTQSGHGPNAWIQNRSGAALQTGATLSISGTVYGRWLI